MEPGMGVKERDERVPGPVIADAEPEVLQPDPDPGLGESGMFLITIDGPRSDEDFGTGFAQIQPALADEHITTVLANDGEQYAIYGFHEFDPRPLITRLIETVDWSTRASAFLKTIGPIGIEIPRPVYDCEMPYNRDPLNPGDHYLTCEAGHKIADTHNVRVCPVCGKGFR
jgi:hypothetical protein